MSALESLENKLRNDAAIACTLLIGDSWPVWELLKRDPDHFKREAALAGLAAPLETCAKKR